VRFDTSDVLTPIKGAASRRVEEYKENLLRKTLLKIGLRSIHTAAAKSAQNSI